MRYVGWVLGGLYLVDGLLALIGKRDFVRLANARLGRRLPHKVSHTLRRATAVNNTAMAAMGISNLIAGAGMVLVATTVGLAHAHR